MKIIIACFVTLLKGLSEINYVCPWHGAQHVVSTL